MRTPDAGSLPPMKPSALPETHALTTTELANALDNCPTHELSMYVAIAIDRLRALAAASHCEECDPSFLDCWNGKGACRKKPQRALAAATEEKDKAVFANRPTEPFCAMANAKDELIDFFIGVKRHTLPLHSPVREMIPLFENVAQFDPEKLQIFREYLPQETANDRKQTALSPIVAGARYYCVPPLPSNYATAESKLTELERENRELREDKARLDWMNGHRAYIDLGDIRQALDAARNGGAT